jgi:5,10-methylenetetrahydromethanopterin reductase
MLEASGALADGVELGAITSPGYVRWAWERIAAGARSAGRDPAALDLASNVLVSVDRDRRAARAATHRVLAYYLHRVEGVVVDASGADPDQVEAVRSAVREQGVEAGAALVSDHLVDVFAAAGEPDEVLHRLRAYVAAGLRGLLAWYVFGPDPRAGVRLLADAVLPRLGETA